MANPAESSISPPSTIVDTAMPTYRYECEACGHGFELFQSMTDKVKRKCPSCGKPKLARLIGAGAGVIFKGSGFYQTDYKGSGSKGRESDGSSTDNAGSKEPAKKDGGSSDSAAKPAESKPAPKPKSGS
ncbi:MAG: FmdB family zinc ribbon protein [Planctomycetota bacterium]